LHENFQNSVPKEFTALQIDLLCSNNQISCNLADGKSVKSWAIYLTEKKQNVAWLTLATVRIAHKICHG